MNKKTIFLLGAVLPVLYFYACTSGPSTGIESVSADSVTINKGKAIFDQACSGCHNFQADGIGPQLSAINTEVSADWLRRFITNPSQVINSGDGRAKQLYQKYKVVMPSPALKEGELNQVIAFLSIHTNKMNKRKTMENGARLTDPVVDKIRPSGLVVGIRLVTQLPSSSDSGKAPLARVSKLDFQPGTGTSFVLDLRGKLYRLINNKPVVYMDMAKLRPKFINTPGLATGFGSFAFHPQFAKNGLIYTTHTELPNSGIADFSYADSIKVTLQWVLTEWKASNPGAAVFSGTGREIFRVNMVAGIHGVQEIAFNPYAKPGNEDYGMLYIGIGDGGSVENGYPFITHNIENIWGSIVRINPAGTNSANGKYGIPSSNPFTGSKNIKVRTEIYAYGFRNPHRISWSTRKQILVANVGHGNIEALDLVVKGGDYGWPVREGTFLLDPHGDLNSVYPLPAKDGGYHKNYPVAQYDHDEGKAISGGFEYTGTAVPQLKGKYLFGDIPTGRLFYTDIADIKQGKQAVIKEWNISMNGAVTTFANFHKNERVDLHFGRDVKGELYLLTKADGKIYKLVSASVSK